MDSRYDHTLVEDKIYELWEAAHAFNPDFVGQLRAQHASHSKSTTKSSKSKRSHSSKPFSIVMPPPNANDPLHLGHAMFVAIEDAFIRFQRMLGDDTVFLPGTDHAGIETQFVFEKKLQKQGKSRFNFDRKTLYSMIWDYVQENSDVAVSQIKKLGASADWSRFTFTLDKPAVDQALQTFTKLHNDGLLYRDLQLVNYCTKCGTSYSELEVKHIDRITTLYYIKYRHADDPSKFELVATTRPEPIFADTHLAIHPTNRKTKHLLGVKLLNPLTDEPMEVIADEFVDPNFGTGIVKLTPAHDFTDFMVAKKHDLPIISAVTTSGKMVNSAPEIGGLSVEEARKKTVEILTQRGLIDLEKTNSQYAHAIGTCYRCGRVLEPLPLPQFFIKVNDPQKSLTKAALKALKTKQTTIHGAGYDKILSHWLKNLKDWNISRQIVWGIRIPVWYDVSKTTGCTVSFIDRNGTFTQGQLEELLQTHPLDDIVSGLQQVFVPQDTPYVISDEMPKAAGQWLPETDTFDTWFSSSQWPITTLKANRGVDAGRSGQAPADDFSRFYPTSVMETAYDILVFWVMRMMLMGIYLTGQSPFSDVYLHGLIRDQKGQKMSKSKGNVINPLEIVGQQGADALRMALVIRSTPGIDKSMGQADIKAMRNLTNKLWNAARFVILQKDAPSNLNQPREVSRFIPILDNVITQVTRQFNDLKIGLAADTIYNEFWHWYCDRCIEDFKAGNIDFDYLLRGLITFLKLLHPFMPFITEAIWQELVAQKLVSPSLLVVAPWPQAE